MKLNKDCIAFRFFIPISLLSIILVILIIALIYASSAVFNFKIPQVRAIINIFSI